MKQIPNDTRKLFAAAFQKDMERRREETLGTREIKLLYRALEALAPVLPDDSIATFRRLRTDSPNLLNEMRELYTGSILSDLDVLPGSVPLVDILSPDFQKTGLWQRFIKGLHAGRRPILVFTPTGMRKLWLITDHQLPGNIMQGRITIPNKNTTHSAAVMPCTLFVEEYRTTKYV